MNVMEDVARPTAEVPAADDDDETTIDDALEAVVVVVVVGVVDDVVVVGVVDVTPVFEDLVSEDKDIGAAEEV